MSSFWTCSAMAIYNFMASLPEYSNLEQEQQHEAPAIAEPYTIILSLQASLNGTEPFSNILRAANPWYTQSTVTLPSPWITHSGDPDPVQATDGTWHTSFNKLDGSREIRPLPPRANPVYPTSNSSLPSTNSTRSSSSSSSDPTQSSNIPSRIPSSNTSVHSDDAVESTVKPSRPPPSAEERNWKPALEDKAFRENRRRAQAELDERNARSMVNNTAPQSNLNMNVRIPLSHKILDIFKYCARTFRRIENKVS